MKLAYLKLGSTSFQFSGRLIPSCGQAQQGTAHSPSFVPFAPVGSCPLPERIERASQAHWRELLPTHLYRSWSSELASKLHVGEKRTYWNTGGLSGVLNPFAHANIIVNIQTADEVQKVEMLKSAEGGTCLRINNGCWIPASTHQLLPFLHSHVLRAATVVDWHFVNAVRVDHHHLDLWNLGQRTGPSIVPKLNGNSQVGRGDFIPETTVPFLILYFSSYSNRTRKRLLTRRL